MDLFEEELAEAESSMCAETEKKKAVAMARKKTKTIMRRANSEQHLFEIIPEIEMGTSYHVISRGDVDSMSFLVHMLRKIGPIDTLTISTWCMAMPDVEEIIQAVSVGMVGFCHFCVGEIFPNQYTDEYLRLREEEKSGKIRVTVARNHSKVMLGANTEKQFVIESSANANTNPRIEQTAIHMDKSLHDFYAEFFDNLKDIDAKGRKS